MPFGAEEIADICGVQKGFNEFGHSGFVAKLAGVTFYGTETGVVDYAVGQRCFANTWRAVEKDDTWASGYRSPNPFQKCLIMLVMEEGADFSSLIVHSLTDNKNTMGLGGQCRISLRCRNSYAVGIAMQSE